MELPVQPAPGRDPALAVATAALRPPAPRLELFDVPLAGDLRRFGESVCASAVGNPSAPPVILLGGISGDCFPCLRPDGSAGWWSGLAGPGSAVDPDRHYVMGIGFAADESGMAAPSTHDQARVLAAALDWIGVARPVSIVGASYGGMVALALAEIDPDRIDRLAAISAGAGPHPASTAARELQRRVVRLGLESGRGEEALAIARGMAMLTYRTAAEFEARFQGGIGDGAVDCCSAPGAYLRARGEAFRSVMSPGRFLSLSASIDRHCVSPDAIEVPTLLVGASSDQLVPPGQMQRLAAALPACELHLVESLFGHDMFLKEAARLGELVGRFLDCAE